MKCECTTAENITEAASQEPGWHTRKEQIKYGFQSDGQYIWAAIMRGVCVGVGCEAGKFSGQKRNLVNAMPYWHYRPLRWYGSYSSTRSCRSIIEMFEMVLAQVKLRMHGNSYLRAACDSNRNGYELNLVVSSANAHPFRCHEPVCGFKNHIIENHLFSQYNFKYCTIAA